VKSGYLKYIFISIVLLFIVTGCSTKSQTDTTVDRLEGAMLGYSEVEMSNRISLFI
jgi:hypothetical protein